MSKHISDPALKKEIDEMFKNVMTSERDVRQESIKISSATAVLISKNPIYKAAARSKHMAGLKPPPKAKSKGYKSKPLTQESLNKGRR